MRMKRIFPSTVNALARKTAGAQHPGRFPFISKVMFVFYLPAEKTMKTDLFNYDLPPELIAQHPPERRELARMMVLHRKTGTIEHRTITDIANYLHTPDVLVLNNTKVIPARVFGNKPSGGKVELLLLEMISGGTPSPASKDCEDAVPPVHSENWKVLMKTSRRPKVGDTFSLCSEKATATMLEDGEQGEALLRIDSERPLMEVLDEEGVPPLPPYIAPQGTNTRTDRNRQTALSNRLRRRTRRRSSPHRRTPLYAGTARPARRQRHQQSRTHPARRTRNLPSCFSGHHHRPRNAPRTIFDIAQRRRNHQHRPPVRRPRCCRRLHLRTHPRIRQSVREAEGSTNIFIYPPYKFKNVDIILTNFHLPKSTLLMMMSAFAGRELMLEAYRIAVEEKYRFFSYGDCMLII